MKVRGMEVMSGRDMRGKYGDPLPMIWIFFACPVPITTGWSRVPIIEVPGDRGAGVCAVTKAGGVVSGIGNGVGEVVGFGDAIWLGGVVRAGNTDVVGIIVTVFCR
jgi:hypothetical protein